MQGRLCVKRRQLITLINQLINARTCCEQRFEYRLAFDQHRSAHALDDRNVAREFDRVAKALFGVNQNRPPMQSCSVPSRLTCIDPTQSSKLPPPLVLRPTAFKIAEKKHCQRLIPMRI